jgi:hypothetical protein
MQLICGPLVQRTWTGTVTTQQGPAGPHHPRIRPHRHRSDFLTAILDNVRKDRDPSPRRPVWR